MDVEPFGYQRKIKISITSRMVGTPSNSPTKYRLSMEQLEPDLVSRVELQTEAARPAGNRVQRPRAANKPLRTAPSKVEGYGPAT